MTVTTAKWTLEDFHQMVDAGLLEGRATEKLLERPPKAPPTPLYAFRTPANRNEDHEPTRICW